MQHFDFILDKTLNPKTWQNYYFCDEQQKLNFAKTFFHSQIYCILMKRFREICLSRACFCIIKQQHGEWKVKKLLTFDFQRPKVARSEAITIICNISFFLFSQAKRPATLHWKPSALLLFNSLLTCFNWSRVCKSSIFSRSG